MRPVSIPASASSPARSLLLVLFLLASVTACFSDPKLDLTQIRHCRTDDNCPAGYVCSASGICCKSADDPTCDGIDASVQVEAGLPGDSSALDMGSGNRLDATRIDSSPDSPLGTPDVPIVTVDGARLDVGTDTGGVWGQDSANGTGGASGADGANDSGVDSPPDLPQVIGPEAGVGGIIGAGGVAGTGGLLATGGNSGATGTGGSSGTGGAPGTGGATVCQASATQCSGGTSLQTCANGQWGSPVPCGVHQTCTGPVGTASCTCNVDPACSAVGTTCANAGTTVLTCASDAQSCLYSSTQTCTNGACYVSAGSATCCTNACTPGTTCLSGTSLQICDVGGNGCTAPSTSTCSAGLVCERYGTAACVDPNWAEWPMPNSQADGTNLGAPNVESYTDNGTTVTDNVTSLMWQKTVPATTYAWDAAIAYCPGISLGGYADWRLPTLIELFSIVDAGRANPSIHGTYFPSTPAALFWSSSPTVGTGGLYAFAVNFARGEIYAHGSISSASYNVRCVR